MKIKCLECDKILPEGTWCSMKCKEKTFIKNFENSQWTTRLINVKMGLLLRKIESMLLFPFEGELKSGKELERPKILDMQRNAFNKIIREEGGKK